MLTFPSHTVNRTTRVYTVSECTSRVYFSLNSEKFWNFHYQAEIGIFEWKSQKMITRMNSRIFTNSSYIWISLFAWHWPFWQWIFSWKISKIIFRVPRNSRIREFIQVVSFVIFPQKWQFRLGNENFSEFSLGCFLGKTTFLAILPH